MKILVRHRIKCFTVVEESKKILVELQKEDQALHTVWKKQHEYLSTYEELRQCKSRLEEIPSLCNARLLECQHDLGGYNALLRYHSEEKGEV